MMVVKPQAARLALRTQPVVAKVLLFGFAQPLPLMYSDCVAQLIAEDHWARGPPYSVLSCSTTNGYQSSAPMAVSRGEL